MAHGTVVHGTIHTTIRRCTTMVMVTEDIIILIITVIRHIIVMDVPHLTYLTAETNEVQQFRQQDHQAEYRRVVLAAELITEEMHQQLQAQATLEVQRRQRITQGGELQLLRELPIRMTGIPLLQLPITQDAELRLPQELPVQILQTELQHKVKLRLQEARLLTKVQMQDRNTTVRKEHIRHHIIIREQLHDRYIMTADQTKVAVVADLFRLLQIIADQAKTAVTAALFQLR